MSSELLNALTAVATRLTQLAAGDDELRNQVRRLAEAILAATEKNGHAGDLRSESPAAPEQLAPASEVLPQLTLGSMPVSVPELSKATWSSIAPVSDTDLSLIETRCRLKAEGSRWAAARQRRLNEGASYGDEIEPRDREIIEKARAMQDCYLWMNNRNSPIPPNLAHWEDVAGCFEAVADAIALIRAILSEQPITRALFEKAIDHLAEAQSALRSAALMVEDDRTDPDQAKVFAWLKLTTAREQAFIGRYMRVDDPADPTTWQDISARIEALDSKLREHQQRRKQQEGRFRRIRYHIKLLQSSGTDHDWNTIVSTVAELVKDGLPPSNVELRELLVSIIDDMPDTGETPVEFRRVLQEVDRFLVSRPSEQESIAPPPTVDVQDAARMLSGQKVLMIGGLRRPKAKEALERAFGLEELVWFETGEHKSVSIFEPYVAQPDVVLVLLAIRWSSHSYGEVKQFCEKYGKAFVRLPGGYNPNQVARQIVQQVRIGS